MRLFCLLLIACIACARGDELESRFEHPPESAKPGVLWMWMGSNINSNGITRDLEALRDAGFGSATMFSLADSCTPWARAISNAPSPGAVTFTEPWWRLVRHAAADARRLGIDFGVHNCAGYESSGGPWITPELSMQEIVWSETQVSGGTSFSGELPRARPDLHSRMQFPLWNPTNGKLEKPEVPARQEFYRDVAVLALPASGIVGRADVVDLSSKLSADGKLDWAVPPGDWIIYRFGRTTMGTLLQPAQWEAIGLECDKMSQAAVEFHMDHIISAAKQQLGDLVGNGFNYYHFDSYEAGTPGWTPKMREEFAARRGYDLTAFLPTLAKRVVGSAAETKKFQEDFNQTIRDLYRENYFPVIQRKLRKAGLKFMCEPYGGPWNITDVVPHVDRIVTEFWTAKGSYSPYELAPTVAAVRAAGRNLIEAEAYTGGPGDSRWTETPAWLKPIGDAAFCDGVNRMLLHRFTHQPFDERWQPGMVMGQWGTHFDRTQTWWEQGKAWVRYLTRCQALLQWGEIATNDFASTNRSERLQLKSIHRRDGTSDVYFIANLSTNSGSALATFGVTGKQPELWNPVTGARRDLPEFEVRDGKTLVPLAFAAAESCFVVFRKLPIFQTRPPKNFPACKTTGELTGAWAVSFDPKWGGPERVTFEQLDDWSKRPEPGIKFYSGTAVYTKTFDLPTTVAGTGKLFLDLGVVRELAEVRLNGKDLGVVWTAPWRVDISAAVKPRGNRLEIKVVNVWANRLIGDEQEPADCEWNQGDQGHGGPLKAFPDWFIKGQPRPSHGRYTFTTWNYFTKDSQLVPAGLLGPVTLTAETNN
ncbi:MAG TPA: glycosyl hydrolase [Verrucomicrobiae bacterium]|nr:glycosyl hydrolase [Verrucomicrobiae bacterium]